MATQQSLDVLYMDIAERISQESHARRLKVGSVIVKNNNIISYGWNGTPSGFDNNCEIQNPDGSMVSKPEVLHAERNALAKLVSSGGVGSRGATLYITHTPCFECSKSIWQSSINRVVFRYSYGDTTGPEFLKAGGIQVLHLLSEI